MANQTPSDSALRNGHPQARGPAPPPMQHSPFSYPAAGAGAGTPQSASQPALGAILSPQPRVPPNMQGMQSPGTDWAAMMERAPPPAMQDATGMGMGMGRPASRPNSFVNASSRTSSESPRPYVGNGQPQVR